VVRYLVTSRPLGGERFFANKGPLPYTPRSFSTGRAMKRLTAFLLWGAVTLLATTDSSMAQAPPVEEAPVPEEETIPAPETGRIEPVKTVELTPELAKKAIDGFVLARDKYANSTIDQYETLEEFASKSEEGRKLEADIEALGFKSLAEWEVAVGTVSLTFGAVSEGSDFEVPQQIEEVKNDASMSEERKVQLIAWLNSLIPTPNNKAAILEVMKDAGYREKLRLLAEEE
jgi:hypothetical protein